MRLSTPFGFLAIFLLASCATAGTARSSPTADPSSALASPSTDVLPRPTDWPVTGQCEESHGCLGILTAGRHASQAFQPPISIETTDGWMNTIDAGGILDLLPIDTPGDEVIFFRSPRAVDADGRLVPGDASVASLTTALQENDWLTVSDPTAVTVGGHDATMLDIAIAPGVTHRPTGCPVSACVDLFRGDDPAEFPTWQYDVGLAAGERARLYLADVDGEVMMILLDSLDGTTFDALTERATPIIESIQVGGRS